MDNTPLDAFNGQLHYEAAWGFDRAGVISFMERVVNDLALHGVTERWRPFARTIRDHIIRLKPDEVREAGQPEPSQPSASYYPIPPQYLHRRTLAYIPPPPPPPEIPPVTFELDPRPVHDHQVYGMYDFLGFFLSLAPAPDGATKDRFFAPWLVIYWKWSELFQATDDEKQDSMEKDPGLNWENPILNPGMVQCTWRRRKKENQDSEEIIFHMGASTGGFCRVGAASVHGPQGTKKNDWQQSIVRFRFNILAGPLRIINNRYEWTRAPKYELSQKQKDRPPKEHPGFLKFNEKRGWDFGNCAETYPFLEILKEPLETDGSKYEGLAIHPTEMKEVLELRPEEIGNFKTPTITDPCPNCTYLLDEKYGIGTANFKAPENSSEVKPVV